VLAELDTHDGATSPELRAQLAAKAFAHTARYDSMVASYLQTRNPVLGEDFTRVLPLVFEKVQGLRYGENPHQKAAFYRVPAARGPSVANARSLQGKELSFNNIADADTAIECVRQFDTPACVVVKHANPCGVATAADIAAAYEAAHRTDPTSAYGGIIAFNRPLDADTAARIVGRQFLEVLVAPQVSPEARAVLATKPGIRVLEPRNAAEQSGFSTPAGAQQDNQFSRRNRQAHLRAHLPPLQNRRHRQQVRHRRVRATADRHLLHHQALGPGCLVVCHQVVALLHVLHVCRPLHGGPGGLQADGGCLEQVRLLLE
jgi:AICAR transformylase/IMP cyclohydrolase PurH